MTESFSNSSFQSHENKVEPNIGNQVSEKDQQSDCMNENDIEKQEKEPEDFEEISIAELQVGYEILSADIDNETIIHARVNEIIYGKIWVDYF